MKQCQLLTQAQLLKMLDKCLLLLVFHTAGKNSLSGKVPGQTAYIKKDPLWMPYEHAHLQSLSQKHTGPSEGAFMGDLALQHLSRGPQQIVGQSWVGLCWKQKSLTCGQVLCSQRIFHWKHNFSWRTSPLVLWRQLAPYPKYLPEAMWGQVALSPGIICAGTLLSSRLGPAHCPASEQGRWHHRCVLAVCIMGRWAGLGATLLALSCGATRDMGQLCTAGLGDSGICHESALGNKGDATSHESGASSCPALGEASCALTMLEL